MKSPIDEMMMLGSVNWQKQFHGILITGGRPEKRKVSISISGLEAKVNARSSLDLAACCPCSGLCGFGGGFEGDEMADNATT